MKYEAEFLLLCSLTFIALFQDIINTSKIISTKKNAIITIYTTIFYLLFSILVYNIFFSLILLSIKLIIGLLITPPDSRRWKNA